MKRIIGAITALVVLVAVAAAYAAAIDQYGATTTVVPNKAGTAAKPVPVGMHDKQFLTSGPGTSTLTNITNTWYGLRSNGKYFATCTAAKIDAAKSDAGCKPESVIATGTVHALVSASGQPAGISCTKSLRIYNAGQNKAAIYLFGPPAQCASVGFLPAYSAAFSASAGALKFVNNIPGFITHPVPGLSGKLTNQTVDWKSKTKTVKGVKHGFFESVACKTSKRAWSVAMSASGQPTEKFAGTLPCTK